MSSRTPSTQDQPDSRETVEAFVKNQGSRDSLGNTQPSTWAETLQQVSGDFATAVTPTPKVIPPVDPLSLSAESKVTDDVYLQAARLQEEQGLFQKAEISYQNAIKLRPNHLEAVIGYARLLDRQKKFLLANSAYEAVLAKHPSRSVAHNDYGLCLARQGRLQEAQFSIQKAIELEPKNKRYRNNLAIVLVELQQPQKALSHLRLAHEEPEALYNLGYLLSQQGAWNDARGYFQQAIEYKPSFTQAREMLVFIDKNRGAGEGQVVLAEETAQGQFQTVSPQRVLPPAQNQNTSWQLNSAQGQTTESTTTDVQNPWPKTELSPVTKPIRKRLRRMPPVENGGF
ncbi:MAG: tetratricopeptide repeat protein [Pirellulaceae bacterium]|nr:tetratricopeptide repeat protein [Pirellulaceae bacterium]